MSEQTIQQRLRGYCGEDCDGQLLEDAADEINRLRTENAWMKAQLQSHSLHMDGTSGWRWRGGWPLTSVRAGDPDAAVKEAMRLIMAERQRNSEAQR